ncbi:unnamed protein product, partial [Symbiodinium microadriaticum]
VQPLAPPSLVAPRQEASPPRAHGYPCVQAAVLRQKQVSVLGPPGPAAPAPRQAPQLPQPDQAPQATPAQTARPVLLQPRPGEQPTPAQATRSLVVPVSQHPFHSGPPQTPQHPASRLVQPIGPSATPQAPATPALPPRAAQTQPPLMPLPQFESKGVPPALTPVCPPPAVETSQQQLSRHASAPLLPAPAGGAVASPTPETSRAVGTPLVAVPASARYETMHVTTRLSRVSLTDSVSGIRTPVSARSFGTPPAGGVRSPRTPLTARSAKIASPTSRRMEEPQTPEPNPRYLAPATPLRAFAIAAEEGGGPCAGEASPQKPPIKVFSERLLRKEDTMPPMPTGAAPVVITLPARESKKAKNPVPARATVPVQGCCSGSGSGPSSPILSAQRAPLSPSSGVRAAIIPGRAIAVRPPPSTPPREHRKVALWPVSGSSRPVSLLRGAGPALVRPLEDPRSSVGAVLRSPKEGDAARPASPERHSPPAMPSLSAPLVRPASPNRLSPAATARPLLNPSPSMPRLASQTSLTSFYSDRGDLQRRPGTVRVPAPSALLQRGVPPDRWGISLDQLCEIENEKHFAAEHTTREVVQHVIWPMTIGKGIAATEIARIPPSRPHLCFKMMLMQKQNTNSSCSTPSDVRKQSWAELSEDLLTDSEPGNWAEDYSSQSSPTPVAAPEPMEFQAKSATQRTFCPQSPQSPTPTATMFSPGVPVIDISGLPKALCNDSCVEAMLEQAGLANVVSSFQTDEVGAVRVFLASWPAAMHCFEHFKKLALQLRFTVWVFRVACLARLCASVSCLHRQRSPEVSFLRRKTSPKP